jgi:hypothetical protein
LYECIGHSTYLPEQLLVFVPDMCFLTILKK